MSHNSRAKKEGVYANTMGIILGNSFEHGLRICHLVAFNNLGLTDVRICDNGRARISDHMHFYGDLGASFLRVAAHVQLDCFKALKASGSEFGKQRALLYLNIISCMSSYIENSPSFEKQVLAFDPH